MRFMVCFSVALALGACVSPTESGDDGDAAVHVDLDAAVVPVPDASVDASALPDAAVIVALDAAMPVPDAAPTTFEGCCAAQGCATTAGVRTCMAFPAENGSCLVDGEMGLCVDVSLCGGAYEATGGLCPGSSDIQCCHARVEVMDAGATDAAVVVEDGGAISFEACCQLMGCADAISVEMCSTYEPQYGRCNAQGEPGVCASTSLCNGWVHSAGFCPGPADIQCCHPPSTHDGGFMCNGTEHPTPNAGISDVTDDARCPPAMKLIGGTVCVDVYEAFINELTDAGERDWSPYFNPGSRRMIAHSAPGVVPQGYINADQAEAACDEAGKRLCSDTEWLRACRGPSSFTYPYGNSRMDGVCNDARSQHPAIEYFGANDPDPFSKIDHPCLNQLPNGLDRTGANAGCVTAEGLFDMMGNLHEWTAAPEGTFRGGFYVDTRINGNGCLYATTAHNRPHWDYSTGFRCCADPLP